MYNSTQWLIYRPVKSNYITLNCFRYLQTYYTR